MTRIDTWEIKHYLSEIKEFYPMINFKDYQEEDECVLALPCMIQRMVVNDYTCNKCHLDFAIKGFRFCARCSFIGLK